MLETIQRKIKSYKKLKDDTEFGTPIHTRFYISIDELEWVEKLILENNKDAKMEDGTKYLSTKFTQKEMSRIGAMCIGTSIGIDMVAEYVRYRISIKKPLKTTRPLVAMVKKLIDAEIKGYDIKQILDIMYDNEWQTFELDWIDKKIPKQKTGGGLSEFGFNDSREDAIARRAVNGLYKDDKNTQGLLK